MGVALLGLVAIWALIIGDVVEGDDVRWLLPAPWVLAGAAGLIALAVDRPPRPREPQVGWVALPSDRAHHRDRPTDEHRAEPPTHEENR